MSNDIRSRHYHGYLVLLFLSLNYSHALHAQPLFRHITEKQGLLQNMVTSLHKDNNGFLWIGTQAGLCRYDGHQMKNYIANGKQYSLSSPLVLSINSTNDNQLLIGTNGGGLNILNLINDRISPFSSLHLKSTSVIRSIQHFKENLYLIGTEYDGLILFNSLTRKTENIDYNINNKHREYASTVMQVSVINKNSLAIATHAGIYIYNTLSRTSELITYSDYKNNTNYNLFNCLIKVSNDQILAGSTNGGLFTLDYLSKKLTPYKNWPKGKPVISLAIDRSNNIWASTINDGLYLIDNDQNKISTLIHNDYNTATIASNNILCILNDENNTTWFGGTGGLSFYNKELTPFGRILPPVSLGDNMEVFSITEDQKGKLWIGCTDKGLLSYTGHNVLRSETVKGFENKFITSVFCDNDNIIWVSSYGEGVKTIIQNTSSLKNELPKSVICFAQLNNEIWMGTNQKGVCIFDKKNNSARYLTRTSKQISNGITYKITGDQILSDDVIQYIYITASKNILLATQNAGLMIINSRQDSITYLLNESSTINSISSNNIQSIFEDLNGNIWAATYGAGINLITSNFKQFRAITTEDGMIDNYVYGIVPENANSFWVSTNKGLSNILLNEKLQLDTDSKLPITIYNYTSDDGLQSNEFNIGAFHKGRSGAIYFGNVAGLEYIKTGIIQHSYINPMPQFTGFRMMGKEYSLDSTVQFKKQLILQHFENYPSFEFASMNHLFPTQSRYEVKLEGYDKNWITSATGNIASYTNLPPGNYQLQVRQYFKNNIKYSENQIGLIILAPWYRTTFAYIIYILTITGITLLTFRLRIRNVRRDERMKLETIVKTQEDERLRLSRDLHDDVGAQLSALRLQLESLSHETEETEKYSNPIGIIDNTITDIRRILMNLSPKSLDEFGLLNAIQEVIDKINSEKTQIHLHINGIRERIKSKDIETALFRILQELLNNTLKYANASNITIDLSYRDNKLIFIYEDDGKGFETRKTVLGYGIQNIKTRAALLGGNAEINSTINKGMQALITIPYAK